MGTKQDVDPEAQVQLATRIPKSVNRAMKLLCVESDIYIADFVTSAIREALARATKGPPAKKKARPAAEEDEG